jgi:hypothetical protein
MTTKRPEFEAIFQETIVPELIAEVHKTGISDNAVEWIAKVMFLIYSIAISIVLFTHDVIF